MLFRKINITIERHLISDHERILFINGGRMVGKTTAVRESGTRFFPHFVELNCVEDDKGAQLFKKCIDAYEFYESLEAFAGDKLGEYKNTLVYIDDIQCYPHLFHILEELCEDKEYHFIVSGNLVGLSQEQLAQLPKKRLYCVTMYPLDFEEFLRANDVEKSFIEVLKEAFLERKLVKESYHEWQVDLFRWYLLVGGYPLAVEEYLKSHKIAKVREVHKAIAANHGVDVDLCRKWIRREMKWKKKPYHVQLALQWVSEKWYRWFPRSKEAFDKLIDSGYVIESPLVKRMLRPMGKYLGRDCPKWYLHDVGLLSALLLENNTLPVLDHIIGIDLERIYENGIAQEFIAHYGTVFCFSDYERGEVDFLLEENIPIGILPVQVLAGKDDSRRSALTYVLQMDLSYAHCAVQLNTDYLYERRGNVFLMPVYNVMFLNPKTFPVPPFSDEIRMGFSIIDKY